MSGLIVACFVVSGATSLVLQVVWVRKLTEVFGSSTLAISTVLATFMAGLALGSFIGGRFADGIGKKKGSLVGSPLFYYACCEAVVAIAALLIPTLISAYRPINASLWATLGETPTLLALARFFLTATVLMIPTTAMGATLPLLGRQVTRSGPDFRALASRLGALYAANTAGAVVGAASAGFWLLPALGASATNRLAAAIAGSLAIAIVVALKLGKRDDSPSIDELALEADQGSEPVVELPEVRARRIALAVYALSGATAMALEVLWSRALAIVIGSSVYSFTLILVVFLIGISLGSVALSRAARRTTDPLGLLAIILALTGVAVALTHWIIDDLPRIFLAMIEGGNFEAGTVLSIHSLLAGVIILPGALGLGAIMPVAMRAYVGSLDAVGRDVGRAYAANTVGAILGSVAGGVAILPLFGIERGVQGCALVYAACAGLICLTKTSRRRRASAAIAALVAASVVLAPRWNQSDFTVGLFRSHLARHYISQGGLVERNVVYYGDGIATTVTVERRDDHWTLRNNGKTEASNKADMPTQILVGLLPVLLRQKDDIDVFVVGYGSGVTIGAITQSPAVSRIDVVELEPKVLEAADRYFGPFNNNAHENPKVHRFIGDGRDVLLAGKRKYDVIVSEPSNPWMAGVSTLFTREFYRFAKKHLAKGGVYCQWAQLYELGPRNVKMIYATFAEAFPFVYAFTPGDATGDTILIGTLEPLSIDLDGLGAAVSHPVARAELDRAEISSPEELVASFFLGPSEVASFTAGADINTDDNAKLEYAAPIDLLNEKRARLAREFRTIGWPYGRLEGIVKLGVNRAQRATDLAAALVAFGRYREAQGWLEVARRAGPASNFAATERLLELALPVDYRDPELPITVGGPPLAPPEASLFVGTAQERQAGLEQVRTAYEHIAEGEWAAAWQAIVELPERADSDQGSDLELLRGYLAYKSLNMRTARSIMRRIVTEDLYRRRPSAKYYLGRVLMGVGNFEEGARHLQTFIADHPDLARLAAESRL